MTYQVLEKYFVYNNALVGTHLNGYLWFTTYLFRFSSQKVELRKKLEEQEGNTVLHLSISITNVLLVANCN